MAWFSILCFCNSSNKLYSCFFKRYSMWWLISLKTKKYHCTKKKFFIKDFFGKCYKICRKLRIWSQLLQKSLMENFIFCTLIYYIEEYFESFFVLSHPGNFMWTNNPNWKYAKVSYDVQRIILMLNFRL